MTKRNWRQYANGFGIMAMLLPALAAGCSSLPGGAAPCAVASEVPAASVAARSPVLTYALVDRSGSYRPLTSTALQLLDAVLPKIVGPGDHVMASKISDSDEPVTTFFSERVDLPAANATAAAPVLPNTPSPHDAQIAYRSYCDAVSTANDAIAKYNTATSKLGQSAGMSYLLALGGFIDKAHAIEQSVPPTGDPSTSICKALTKASEIVSSPVDGQSWSERRILIFSDMEESPPSGIQDCNGLNLKGTSVAVVLWQCAAQVGCDDWKANRLQIQKTWDDIFTRSGADLRTPDFLRVEVSDVDAVTQVIK